MALDIIDIIDVIFLKLNILLQFICLILKIDKKKS